MCVLQGQSRRVQVEVRSVQDSGTMPLIAEIVLGVSIGCVEIKQMRPAKGNDAQQVQYKTLFTSRKILVTHFSESFIPNGCQVVYYDLMGHSLIL